MQYNQGVRAGVGLIGRDDEIDTLTRFLDGAGRGALVVRGEAGVGKTALVEEIVDRAVAAGWRVIRATGVEAETPFALSGLNQIVFALRAELAQLGVDDQTVLAPVLGADATSAPAPMPLVMALLSLLTQAAERDRLLLVVEDMHWFDDVSASVLNAAGRRLSDPRLRFVATARPVDGDHAGEGWDELALHPLTAAAAARLVDLSALSLSTTTRRMILDVAAGNPLALQELPRNAGQIDTWTSAVPLTDRLVTVFGSRLGLLDDRVRRELLRAALDGTPATTSVDAAGRYVLSDVDAAVAQGLLVNNPSGDVVFRHPLVRAAVIHQASAPQRRDAHAHLAQLYDDELMRQATHLSAAAIGPDQVVADLLDRAAHLSIRLGGSAIAVDWLRRAAELCTEPARRERLRADAAFVASQASRFDDARRLADDPLAETESVASVLTTAYVALYRDGDVLTTHRQLFDALSDVDDLDDATVTRLVKLLLAVTLYNGDPERWQQTDDVVDRLASRLDADALLLRDSWGDVCRRGHTVRRRLDEERARVGRREPWDVMRLGVAAYYVDGLADFRGTLATLFRRESERGAITSAMTMLHLILLDHLATGDWQQAEQSIRLGLDLTEAHRNDLFRHQFIAYEGLHAAASGDVDAARRCATEVQAWAQPRRVGLLSTIVRRTETLVALGAGDYVAAHAATTEGHAGQRFPPYSKQPTEELLDVVDAAVHAGHLDRAQAYVEQAIELRIADISPRLAALTVAVRAMTAADGSAGELYDQALAHPGLAQNAFERNRIHLTYGMWLRRRRRTAEARAQLTLAADGFRALSAHPWEQRATGELRASGAAVHRAPGGSVALSAQERTIAELAAAGQSNKDIATRLHLSPRTVGAHLYRIFPKLGVTSRAALGQALKDAEQ
ncbi:helix-turn-helix transcriptional regulator [Mycolicibacterium sp. P1-18]|uniref:ATP-binding protein n=1 Tax=Mycolicibacterium sp. P1-18 TaxID=2024615 RepID=UPI0011F1AD87|nr:LuxR family transcriptional regulator [Mycolicibacterium sp. P1-18]KAA0094109.1 helix-turn-helix transcriptional regulator [Mycolicibacterium sp. P1-18]